MATSESIQSFGEAVNTPLERFCEDLGWVTSIGYRGFASRDLGPYVENPAVPADPWAGIERR